MTTMHLFGVGVGPGDPELVTIKAVRVLTEAGLVLVPVMAGARQAGPGRAEATVRAHVDGARIRRVPFALSDRGGVTPGRRAAWEAAAREVATAFAGGTGTVAFATIGDPNIYSTFSYLAQTVRELVPGVAVHTVPGITAMQDLAARSGTVLAEGSESLVLLPLEPGPLEPDRLEPDRLEPDRLEPGRLGPGRLEPGPLEPGRLGPGPLGPGRLGPGRLEPGPLEPGPLEPALRDALARHDTVVVYKLGGAASGGQRTPETSALIPALLATLQESGRLDDAIYGARLGLPGEDIRPVRDLTGTTAVPYLSALIAPGRRSGTGSKLR